MDRATGSDATGSGVGGSGAGGSAEDRRFAELVDRVEGRLDAAQDAAVAERIACGGPELRAALAWLERFAELAPSVVLVAPPASVAAELESRFREQVADRDRTLVRALLTWDSDRDRELAGARAAMAPARRARHLVYDADGIDVVLDLFPLDGNRFRVDGQVLPPPGLINPITSVRVVFERRSVAEAGVDDVGGFVLNGLGAGVYDMVLLGGSLRIELEIALGPGPGR